MVYNVRRVGKQFKQGRQEDAHEYLRQLLDTMHEEVLKANRVKLSDGKVSETTFVGRVFGGDLCNELRCKQVRAPQPSSLRLLPALFTHPLSSLVPLVSSFFSHLSTLYSITHSVPLRV
jgi:hypothetical protein